MQRNRFAYGNVADVVSEWYHADYQLTELLPVVKHIHYINIYNKSRIIHILSGLVAESGQFQRSPKTFLARLQI